MKKAVTSYRGVTGFTCRDQVEAVLGMVPESPSWHLMVGVLASHKTLVGKTSSWRANRFPLIGDFNKVFVDDPRTLNLIHYSTDEPDHLAEQLFELTDLAGPYCHGFQLNVLWPDQSQIERYRDTYPDRFLVLQIGAKAMQEASTMSKFVTFLENYVHLVDSVLIDASGGINKPINPENALDYLVAIPQDWEIKRGIAGGLSGETLEKLAGYMIRTFPYLSIDAEGGLRTPQPEDALDLIEVQSYLDAAEVVYASAQ